MLCAGCNAILQFTLPYAPPEVVAAWQHGHTAVIVSAAVDIWAFGVIAYELLSHEVWHQGLTQDQMVQAITTEGRMPWESASPQERSNVRKMLRKKLQRLAPTVLSCLARDAAQRPDAGQIVASLDGIYHSTNTGTTTAKAQPAVRSQHVYLYHTVLLHFNNLDAADNFADLVCMRKHVPRVTSTTTQLALLGAPCVSSMFVHLLQAPHRNVSNFTSLQANSLATQVSHVHLTASGPPASGPSASAAPASAASAKNGHAAKPPASSWSMVHAAALAGPLSTSTPSANEGLASRSFARATPASVAAGSAALPNGAPASAPPANATPANGPPAQACFSSAASATSTGTVAPAAPSMAPMEAAASVAIGYVRPPSCHDFGAAWLHKSYAALLCTHQLPALRCLSLLQYQNVLLDVQLSIELPDARIIQ